MSKRVAAGAFKAHCLRLIDEVAKSRTEIVVTKHGKPKARLVPIDDAPPVLLGCLRGTITIFGDIVAPIDEAWNADNGDAAT